jgi:predicted aspartyl protease
MQAKTAKTHIATHFVALSLITIFSLMFLELSASASTTNTEQLKAQIVAAYGGYQNLKDSLETATIAEGKATIVSTISGTSNSFDCRIFSKGDKFRLEMDLLGQKFITAYNGKNSWVEQGDQVFPADPTTSKQLTAEVEQGSLLLLKLNNPNSKISADGTAIVNGELCDVIKITSEYGKDTVFYTNKKTHLVDRYEFTGTNMETGLDANQQFDCSDYRPFMKSVAPFKVREYCNSKLVNEENLVSMKSDAELSDSLFDMPAIAKIERLQKDSVTVPFDFIGNEIIVQAKVNNKMSYPFIIDTGATQSILDETTARAFGSVGESNYSATTGSGSVKLDYVNLSQLQLGDMTLESLPFGVTDLSPLAQMIPGTNPAGLLGANILRRFAITIDYKKRLLTFSDPAKFVVPANAIVIKTKPSLGFFGIAVNGLLDDKLKTTFVIDTGAAFNNIAEKIAKPLLNEDVLPVSTVVGLDGKKISVGAAKFNSIKLGNFVSANPIFSIAPENAATPVGLATSGSFALLGNPFLSQFKVTIDYLNQHLILEQTPQEIETRSIEQKLAGIHCRYSPSSDKQSVLKKIDELYDTASKQNLKGAQALCLINKLKIAYGHSLLSEDQAIKAMPDFKQAINLAHEDGDPSIQSCVLSCCALFAFENLSDPIKSKQLLMSAVHYDPLNPCFIMATVSLLKRSNNNPNSALVQKAIDQALVVDPSCYDALVAKYEYAKKTDDTKIASLTAKQFKHYYPDLNLPESGTVSGASSSPKSKP